MKLVYFLPLTAGSYYKYHWPPRYSKHHHLWIHEKTSTGFAGFFLVNLCFFCDFGQFPCMSELYTRNAACKQHSRLDIIFKYIFWLQEHICTKTRKQIYPSVGDFGIDILLEVLTNIVQYLSQGIRLLSCLTFLYEKLVSICGQYPETAKNRVTTKRPVPTHKKTFTKF